MLNLLLFMSQNHEKMVIAVLACDATSSVIEVPCQEVWGIGIDAKSEKSLFTVFSARNLSVPALSVTA
ncbi:hypothetical protein NIES3974_12610 [Calothrix sp. NIES-3974]|nr:hypothetical protein NIES3974_12610 [Calothrix sp. NIES-3974]